MKVLRVILRELRFWGQAAMVCSMPLAFIYFLADYLGFPSPFHVPDAATSHAHRGWADVGFLVLVIAFYAMRVTDRVAYGFAEVLFALIGFGIFFDKLASTYSADTFLLTTGGFIYVAVRGLDNIITGARRHYADPMSDPRWFF